MKKLQLLFCAVALVMTSCTLSNEEKAEKLVSACIKDYLTFPESYEAISTRVDSSRINVSKIEQILEVTKEVAKLYSKIESIERKMDLAQSTMEIYAPTRYYYSEHSRGEYNRAKKEIEDYKSDLERLNPKLNNKISDLRNAAENIYDEKVNGWAVTHRFRSKGENGEQAAPEEMIFFCDFELEHCQGWTTKQYEFISKIIKQVADSDSDSELLDNLSGLQYLL